MVFFGLATLHTFPCRLKTLLWFLFSDDYESRPSTHTCPVLGSLILFLLFKSQERRGKGGGGVLSCSVCISSSFFSPPFPKRISPFPSSPPPRTVNPRIKGRGGGGGGGGGGGEARKWATFSFSLLQGRGKGEKVFAGRH